MDDMHSGEEWGPRDSGLHYRTANLVLERYAREAMSRVRCDHFDPRWSEPWCISEPSVSSQGLCLPEHGLCTMQLISSLETRHNCLPRLPIAESLPPSIQMLARG